MGWNWSEWRQRRVRNMKRRSFLSRIAAAVFAPLAVGGGAKAASTEGPRVVCKRSKPWIDSPRPWVTGTGVKQPIGILTYTGRYSVNDIRRMEDAKPSKEDLH